MLQDLDPKLAEQAKAADTAALRVFHEKVLELAVMFSIKEAARLLRVSTGYLRTYTKRRGITFADRTTRTSTESKELKKQWEHYKLAFDLSPTDTQAAPVRPGELAITPGLDLKSRKAWVEGQNAFLARCVELAEVFSVAEAAEILGVTHRFLKNYAYNEQLTFVGGPSLDVKNEFYERAEKLAAESAKIQDAAKQLNVTSRYLTGYAKHWDLSFVVTDIAAAIVEEDDAEGDHSFMQDMCIDVHADGMMAVEHQAQASEQILIQNQSAADNVPCPPQAEANPTAVPVVVLTPKFASPAFTSPSDLHATRLSQHRSMHSLSRSTAVAGDTLMPGQSIPEIPPGLTVEPVKTWAESLNHGPRVISMVAWPDGNRDGGDTHDRLPPAKVKNRHLMPDAGCQDPAGQVSGWPPMHVVDESARAQCSQVGGKDHVITAVDPPWTPSFGPGGAQPIRIPNSTSPPSALLIRARSRPRRRTRCRELNVVGSHTYDSERYKVPITPYQSIAVPRYGSPRLPM